ncbi:MAG: DHH family phosphoesterase [Methanomicrobiales archaeon]|nr:DHH family phosphoesterase [Methanomicrobiales archaeon]NYT20862.1 DHH family phosphoesterase [Methanomicrobiales archaeon]
MPLTEAASRVAEHLSRQEYVEVYAHHDADGIAAGTILCTALFRKGIRFRLRVLHRVSAASISPDTPTLLCDLGSGIEDLPKEVMVVDHHLPRFSGDLHVNPRLAGIDADRELSSAGAAYIVAQALGDNRDLAGLVMLGILGDGQEIAGKNREIFNEAVAESLITPGKGCRLPGRDLHERLLCSTHPYLHQISGDEMAVADLIESVSGEGSPELESLLSLILLRISPFAPAQTMESLYGERYSLEREVVPDAHALTAVVDACGKCGHGGLAASLCFRSAEGLGEAWEISLGHRLQVIRALRFALEKPDPDGFYTVEETSVASDLADALIRDTLIGPRVMVAAKTGDLCHISIRTVNDHDLRLGDAVHEAAVTCGGFGGGHSMRAGATVSCARLEEFREVFGRIVAA